MGLHDAHKAMRQRKALIGAAVVAALAVLLEGAGEAARGALAWDREALAQGQLWRLVTGHFVHLGWSHLALNVAGLGLVVWITGKAFSPVRWLLIALITIAAIDAGFWFLDRDLEWYVGLSGLLHGLLVAGLFVGALERDREAIILAAVVLGKLIWEQALGPLPGSASTSGGPVIVDAHLYGALGGLLGTLVLWHRVRPGASL